MDAAEGLDYTNRVLSIQHRDVKPQNLLLVGGGRIKVADFGLALVLEHTTHDNGPMTPTYAAPEFFRGETTRQSDQYSLAASYCHMRCGRPPFVGNVHQIMAGHLMEEPDLTRLPEAERGGGGARALAKGRKTPLAKLPPFMKALLSRGPDNDRGGPHARSPVDETWNSPPPLATETVPPRSSRVPDVQPGEPLPAPAVAKAGSEEAKPLAPVPTNSIGMTFVPITPGTFLMGSPDSDPDASDDEKPQHRVTISKPFLLAIHPVTQGQYRAVTGQSPSFHRGSDDLPVEKVSWNDAIAFCNKLSEREGLKPYDRSDAGEPSRAGMGIDCRRRRNGEYALPRRAARPGTTSGTTRPASANTPGTATTRMARPTQWARSCRMAYVFMICMKKYMTPVS